MADFKDLMKLGKFGGPGSIVVSVAVGEAFDALIDSFDDTSKEICQCLAIINETLLQIRDGIKVGPGAAESIRQGALSRELERANAQIAVTQERLDELEASPNIGLSGENLDRGKIKALKEQIKALKQNTLDLQIKLKRFDEIDPEQLDIRIGEAEKQTAEIARRLERAIKVQKFSEEVLHPQGNLTEEEFAKGTEEFNELVDEAKAVNDALKQLKLILEEVTGAPTEEPAASASGLPFFALGAQVPVTAEGIAQLFTNPGESAEAVNDALETIGEKHEQLVEVAEDRNTDLMKRLGDAVDEFADRAASSLADLVLTGELSARKIGQVFKNLAFDFARQQLNNLFNNILSSIFSIFIPGRAAGGKINPGVPVLVGERGPELIVPFDAGRVIDATRTRALTADGGGGPVTVNQSITFTTDVQNSVRAEVLTMAPAVAQAARDAVIGTLTRPRF